MSMINLSTPGGATAAENEIDLGRLLGELIDHRVMIVSITAFFTLVAVVWALFSTPVYQADALVQIEQKQGNALLNSLSQMMPNTSPESAPELQLLQSRMILGKTIDDLNLRSQVQQVYWPVLGRGWARLTRKKPGTVTLNWLHMPRVHGKAQTLLLTVGKKGRFRLSGKGFSVDSAPGEMVELGGISVNIRSIDAPPGTRFILKRLTELEAINELQKGFSVSERGKDSGMLGLTMKGDNPQHIADVLNSIANNYLQQNVARQAAQDSRSLDFLQTQLPKVRGELDQAEDRLNRYRKASDSVDLNLEAKSVLEQVVNVDNQLNELTFREAEISQLYKKDHPTYKALMDKRRTLENEKVRLSKRVSTMPSMQQEILRLSRDVESGRAVYLQLLNRQQELSIARSSAIGNVRIIDEAVTQPRPVAPKKTLIVMLGVMLGLMVSVGGVFMRSMLRRGIVSPEQLEEKGINVYATVPLSEWLQKNQRQRSKQKLSHSYLALDNPADLAVESIRSLRTSLHFAMMEAPDAVLMISGATPDSGKTFVSSTLAAIVAQSALRVLYIDADMRKGYAHELFTLPNEKGLSDVLSGKTPLEQAVQAFPAGGFDVLTRGQVPPNPSELLMHERFRSLLHWANNAYDMVIVDTPPILAVTDAAVIGRSAGTSLVVARFGMNSVKEMTVCVQRLEQGGVKVKGAILNGVVKRASSRLGEGYHHYGYRYDEKSGV